MPVRVAEIEDPFVARSGGHLFPETRTQAFLETVYAFLADARAAPGQSPAPHPPVAPPWRSRFRPWFRACSGW